MEITLLDTNAVIYLQKGLLAKPLPVGEYALSFISEMELLSWRGLTPNQYDWLSKFMNQLQIYEIDRETKHKAIELRRENQIKLPDAIIAATAITKNAMLLTNDADYLKMPV